MQNTSNQELDFSFMSMPEIGNDFLVKLDAIREAAPVFWSEKQHAWLFTRHQDVLDSFQGKFPLSNQRLSAAALTAIPEEERASTIPLLVRFVPMLINNTDAPLHTRVRKLVMKSFGRKTVENIRGYVQGNIERFLDEAEAAGEVEFNSAIARPITARTILKLLGIPEEHLGRLGFWATALNVGLGTVDPPRELLLDAEKSLGEMFELFQHEIGKRRVSPQEDIFTGLVQAIDDGDRLTMDEMIGVSVILLLAGHDTTLNSMTLGVEALSHRGDLRDELYHNPGQAVAAAIELSRTTAMSSFESRVVTEDFELHGTKIRAGDFVLLMIAAGNRDPRAFDNPLEIDFHRSNDSVLTWAPGIHHCVGHLLAKMQLGEFFARAYRRYDQIEVVNPVKYAPAPSFRGIPDLRVRFHRRLSAQPLPIVA